MIQTKFKVADFVKYKGKVYEILNITWTKRSESYLYDVRCVQDENPDDPTSSLIGQVEEDNMELVQFSHQSEKEKTIERACKWLKHQMTYGVFSFMGNLPQDKRTQRNIINAFKEAIREP